jgi:hypothetical protein
MKTRISLVVTVLALLLTVGAGSAMADITYNLTVDNCTGGCLTGVVGTSTVLLHQNGTGDVRVTVTLASPLMFVNTGLVETIDFNLGSITSGVTAVNFTNANFSLDSGNAGSNHFDGFGNFQYAIALNTAQGAGGAQSSPLSFDIKATGLTESSFTTNATGWFFGVDVYNPTRNTTGPIGTGSNGVLSGGGSNVPEPGSIVLLSTVFLSLMTIMRKRAQRTNV